MKFTEEQILKLEEIRNNVEEEDLKNILRIAYDRWFSEEVSPMTGLYGIEFDATKTCKIPGHGCCCLLGTAMIGLTLEGTYFETSRKLLKDLDLINNWQRVEFALICGFDRDFEKFRTIGNTNEVEKYYKLAENISNVIFGK